MTHEQPCCVSQMTAAVVNGIDSSGVYTVTLPSGTVSLDSYIPNQFGASIAIAPSGAFALAVR